MQTILDKYKLQNVLFILLIAYLLVVRILLMFSYSLDLEGAEYTFVHFVQKIEYAKTLYQNPLVFPFTNCVYNPLYPYLIWIIAKAFALDFSKDIHAIFMIGRVISFVCILIQIVYVIKFIQLFEKSKSIILLGVLLYLLLITGHFYAMRPDAIVTTMFSVFVYETVVYFYHKSNVKYWIKISVYILLMTLLKQDFIIHIFLFLGILFLLQRTKATFLLMMFSVFLVVLTYIVLFSIFGENYIYNTVLFNFQVTSNVRNSYNLVIVAISICRILPLLFLSIILYVKYYKQQNRNILLLFILTGFFEFVICHLLMFRAGSFINYSYVTILFLVISCSVISCIPSQKKYLLMFIFICYLIGIIGTNVLLKNYSISLETLKKEEIEYKDKLKDRDKILSYVGNAIYFMPNGKNVIFLSGSNCIYGYDFHINRYLYLITGFKSTTKLTYIKSDRYDSYFNDGKLKYILLESATKNDAYIQQYYPNYKLTDTISSYQVYSYLEVNN